VESKEKMAANLSIKKYPLR